MHMSRLPRPTVKRSDDRWPHGLLWGRRIHARVERKGAVQQQRHKRGVAFSIFTPWVNFYWCTEWSIRTVGVSLSTLVGMIMIIAALKLSKSDPVVLETRGVIACNKLQVTSLSQIESPDTSVQRSDTVSTAMRVNRLIVLNATERVCSFQEWHHRCTRPPFMEMLMK